MQHAKAHLDVLCLNENWDIREISIFEIGTGWHPVVPFSFFLCGGNQFITGDIRKLYSQHSINQTILAFLKTEADVGLKFFLPSLKPERLMVLKDALLTENRIQKLSMVKVKSIHSPNYYLGLTQNSVDLVVSNNTLQFFSKDDLFTLFQELKHKAKPDALLSFSIDFTDEYSHFDTSKSKLNFLKFSAFEWSVISNPFYSPNRIRFSEFKLILASSFNIISIKKSLLNRQELLLENVNPEFANHDLEDLRIGSAQFICKNIRK